MLFHTDAAITNGVLLNAFNIGQRVEWTAVLRDLRTGNEHRTIVCAGTYVGSFVEPQSGWLYAEFEEVTLDGRKEDYVGLPVAFFRHAS